MTSPTFYKSTGTLIAFFVLVSIAFFFTSNALNEDAIWFRNIDQDSMNFIGALDYNTGNAPRVNDHPGLGTYFIYGKCFQIAELLGIPLVSDLDKFEKHNDPILFLPHIYLTGRLISIFICIFTAFLFSLIVYECSQNRILSCISFILILFSKGILFQSLICRNELLSLCFINISLWCIAKLCNAKSSYKAISYILLSGIFASFSYFTKIQVIPFLGLIYLLLIYIGYRKQKRNIEISPLLPFLISGLLVIISFSLLSDFESSFLRSTLVVLSIMVILLIVADKSKSPKVQSNYVTYFKAIVAPSTWFTISFLLGIILIYGLMFYGVNSHKFQLILEIVFFEKAEANYGISNLIKPEYSNILLAKSWFGMFKEYLTKPIFWLVLISSPIFFFYRKKMVKMNYKLIFLSLLLFVGIVLISSLRRGFLILNKTYFVYTDYFLILASLLILHVVLYQRPHITKYGIVLTVIVLLNPIISTIEANQEYPDKFGNPSSNQVEEVNRCVYNIPNFARIMENKYGSYIQVRKRIIQDDRLNGSNRGIDISQIIDQRHMKNYDRKNRQKMKKQNSIRKHSKVN